MDDGEGMWARDARENGGWAQSNRQCCWPCKAEEVTNSQCHVQSWCFDHRFPDLCTSREWFCMILYVACTNPKCVWFLAFGFTSFITWLLCCGAHAGPTSVRTQWVSDSNYLHGQWCTTVLVYNSYASHRILYIDWACCDETIYVIVYSMSFNHFDYFATFSFQTTSRHLASKHRQIYLQEAFVSCLHTLYVVMNQIILELCIRQLVD